MKMDKVIGAQGPADGQVPALVRAARILDTLAADSQPKGVSELARDLDLPKSSIHGLCRTLADLGLLARAGANQYSIGPHVLSWANAFQSQSSLTMQFQLVCGETQKLKGEALNLTVLSGASVLYVACRPGSSPLGVSFRVGMSLPALFTATGKAIMSTMQPDEVDRVIGPKWPAPMTRSSVRDRAALQVELEKTRERGYSIDDGQLREGMYCFGAPVFSAGSRTAIAGLAVGMLSAEVTPAVAERVGGDLAALAGELSSRLGGGGRR